MKSKRDEPTYSLSDWDWIGSSDGRAWLDEFALGDSQDREHLRRIRVRLGDDRASLVAYQAELRQIASRKFSAPNRWLWTRTLLEQASDEATSRLTASYFPSSSPVLDLCCGAGADSVALASRHANVATLQCIDQSPVATRLTQHNLAAHRLNADVETSVVGISNAIEGSPDHWIQLDPDRRIEGHRTTSLEFFSPGEAFFEYAINRFVGGSIKLAPATEIPPSWQERLGRQFIGVAKSVRQQRVWWGTQGFQPDTVTVSILRDAQIWHHCSFETRALEESIDRVQPMPASIGWIGDVDPAVRAANATTCIAKLANATVIGDSHGYLAASEQTPSLFVDWFQVQDILSLDVKKLRKHLRERNVGTLEIKKRGVDIDIEQFRRELKLSGSESATLILVRDRQRRIVLLAQRAKRS